MTKRAAPLFHFWESAYACWKQTAYRVFVRPDTYNRTIDEGKPA
jgi:hypothetical protein